MIRTKKVLFLIGALIGASILFYQGCGTYEPPELTSGTPSFVGLGSEWFLYLDGGAGLFELIHQPSLSISEDYVGLGPYQGYTNGFTGMTVNTVNDGTDGPVLGATSYGIQIPGFAYFMAPFTTPGSVIGMIPWGTCPGDLSLNWIKIRAPSSWAAGSGSGNDSFGTMTYASANGVSSVVNDFNLDTVANNDSTSDAGARSLSSPASCSSGALTDGSDDTLVSSVNLTLHTLDDDSIYFAVPSGSSVTVANLAGSYSGILYSAGSSANYPLTLTLATSGGNVTGTASLLANVTTGTSAGVTNPTLTLGNVTLSDSAASGFVAGEINFDGPNDPLVCLPQTSAGGGSQTVLVCAGTDDSGAFYSIVLVSQ